MGVTKPKSDRWMRPCLWMAALGQCWSVGCMAGTEDPPSGTSRAPVSRLEAAAVISDDAPEGPQAPGSMPPIPGLTDNDPEGSFSGAPQLASEPTEMDDAWIASATGHVFAVPSVMAPRLREARAEAISIVNDNQEVFWDLVDQWVGILDELGVSLSTSLVSVSPGARQQRSIAYSPEYGRWQSRLVAADGASSGQNRPDLFAELDQRGARLYCAARNAEVQQSPRTRVMGTDSALDVEVLGHRLGFMVIQPTLAMAHPQRYDSGESDGGQTFVVPFTAGARIAPIPFLPSLPGLSTPVALVTGDSAVRTTANQQSGSAALEEWTTLGHVDGFISATRTPFTLQTADMTLFNIAGVIDVKANLSLSLETTSCAQGNNLRECRNQTGRVARFVRGVSLDGGAPGLVTTPARSGGFTTPNNTGVGAYNDAAVVIHMPQATAVTEGFGALSVSARMPDPMSMRMRQNNDKALDTYHSASATLELLAQPAFGDAVFKITPRISGSITAGLSVVHQFREREEILQRPPPPPGPDSGDIPLEAVATRITAFTVTPAVQTSWGFDTAASLLIELSLGPLSLSKDVVLWSDEASIHDSELRPWPEQNRLRLDTRVSDPTAPLQTRSHWPGTGNAFDTFGEIAECFPPDTARSEFPASCPSRAPQVDGPLEVGLCHYRVPWPYGPDEDADGPAGLCWMAMQPWIAEGTGYEQRFSEADGLVERSVVSRRVDLSDDNEATALQLALSYCAQLYDDAGRLTEFEDDVFNFAICDEDGTLYRQLMKPIETDGAGPSPAGSCD